MLSAGRRRWRSEEGRRYSEDVILFGDCSETARAEFPGGVIRLVGIRTGHEITWPLPEAWEGDLHRMFVDPLFEVVMLDIRGATPADSYVMTISLDGTARTFPAGWEALGWTSLDFFMVKREHEAGVEFAAIDVRDGGQYDIYPENELREVLLERLEEQRREIERARAAKKAGR